VRVRNIRHAAVSCVHQIIEEEVDNDDAIERPDDFELLRPDIEEEVSRAALLPESPRPLLT